MKVYAFIYNPMIEESSHETVSLHYTKLGAKKALKEHKEKRRKEWEEFDKFQRKTYGDKLKGNKFGKREDWRVVEFNILP